VYWTRKPLGKKLQARGRTYDAQVHLDDVAKAGDSIGHTVLELQSDHKRTHQASAVHCESRGVRVNAAAHRHLGHECPCISRVPAERPAVGNKMAGVERLEGGQ